MLLKAKTMTKSRYIGIYQVKQMTKYQLIYEELKKAILRREIAPNQLLPSEKALTIKYNVSRITAKHALNQLVADDLIYRIKGKGSFVKPHGTSSLKSILLVLPFSSNNELGNYVLGIQHMLKNTTWNLLSMTNEDFRHLSYQQIAKNYAGVIYYPLELAKEFPQVLELYQQGLPLVLLDKALPNSVIPSVVSDNVGGGFLAGQYLQDIGKKRLVFYSNTNFWESFTGPVADRFMGFIKACRLQKMPLKPLKTTKLLYEKEGMDLVTYLSDNRVDGIVAENDIVAYRILNLLLPAKIQVPDQIAIVGFDNLPLTAMSSPPLSSIGQDFFTLGEQAVNLLLQQINDPQAIVDRNLVVDVKLSRR